MWQSGKKLITLWSEQIGRNWVNDIILLTIFLCVSITPFGVPVVPEVYIIVTRLSSVIESFISSSLPSRFSSAISVTSLQCLASSILSKVNTSTGLLTLVLTRLTLSSNSLSATKTNFTPASLKINS